MTQFYAEGTFWAAIVGSIGTIALGLTATWFASKQIPKRCLTYHMSDPIALLRSQYLPKGLEILRTGQVLKDPELVDITLQSAGRQPITAHQFIEKVPLTLNLGVPIVEVLRVESFPPERTNPPCGISDTTLVVGPCALAAKQRVIFSLLVDGKLKLTSNLPDVEIRHQEGWATPVVRRKLVFGLAATVIVVCLVVGYSRFTAVSVPTRLAGATPSVAETAADRMLPLYGWNSSKQFGCLQKLWERASGWSYDAVGKSGAYGIPQALPGTVMGDVAADWRTDAITQIKWGLGYIQQRYKSPCEAWSHELADSWY
jgi:hypothetical protein